MGPTFRGRSSWSSRATISRRSTCSLGARARREPQLRDGGDLARSPRWDEVMRPVGIGDIAAVACRDALGCWGWIEVYRDGGDRRFERGNLELLASLGPSMGSALRRGFITATESHVVEPSPPGVVVLNRDLGLVTWTATAREWIDSLPAARLFAAWNMLPAAVYPVATLSRSQATRTGAHALERAVDGRWVVIQAAPLEGDDGGRLAVTIRGAAPRETFDLLCRAYALTRRERDVVAAVLGRTRYARRHRAALRRPSHGAGPPQVGVTRRSASTAVANYSRPLTPRPTPPRHGGAVVRATRSRYRARCRPTGSASRRQPRRSSPESRGPTQAALTYHSSVGTAACASVRGCSPSRRVVARLPR